MSKIANKVIKVFVYGTLKQGEPNHYWLTRAENGVSKFLGHGKTVNKYPLVVGTRYNIPFLLDRPGVGNQIEGEVYEVDEAMFANLDILEDYPNYYDRQIEEIASDKGTFSCWMYLIRKFPEQLLEKPLLSAYHNTVEQPYRESYLDSNKDDMYVEFEEQPPKA